MSTHDSPQATFARFSVAELLWWMGGAATTATAALLLDAGHQLPAALIIGAYLSTGLVSAVCALVRLRRAEDAAATPEPPPDWTDEQLAQLHHDAPTGPIAAVVQVDLDANKATVRPPVRPDRVSNVRPSPIPRSPAEGEEIPQTWRWLRASVAAEWAAERDRFSALFTKFELKELAL